MYANLAAAVAVDHLDEVRRKAAATRTARAARLATAGPRRSVVRRAVGIRVHAECH
jgi:hypothetical protein